METLKAYKAYKYRLYPTADQEVLLAKHFGSCRWVYNYGLEQKNKYYAETGKCLNKYDLANRLPELKKEFKWLKEINSQSLQQSLLDLEKGFTAFFKKQNKMPVFKSKYNNYKSFRIPQTFGIEEGKLRIPKFRKGIKVVYHRPIEGKMCYATVIKTPTNKYFVSVTCEITTQMEKKESIKETALGLDLGLTDFVITSEGEKFERHRFIKPKKKKLRKVQKKLSKAKKSSNNRNKARLRVAIVHEKIANKRSDLSHKVSRVLVEKNQINTYCLEDLNVKGIMKNHKLTQSIMDVGWAEFVWNLTYKAEWVGKNIKQIGRFEASSKTCSCCGSTNRTLILKDRNWTCGFCKAKHDRDVNAAINIKNFAFHLHETEIKTTAGTAECNASGDVGSKLRQRKKKPKQLAAG
jgi:putative transposase